MIKLCAKQKKIVFLAIAFVCFSPTVVTATEYDWRSFPTKFMAKPSKARDMCDRAAAHPEDLQRRPGVEGVAWNGIDNMEPAVNACKTAITEAPDDPILIFQYGRALVSEGLRTYNKKLLSDGMSYLKKAADVGHRHSLLVMGFVFERDFVSGSNYDTALRLYQNAIDEGYSPALHPITCLYKHRAFYKSQGGFKGFGPGQIQRAIERLESAAASGSVQAALVLGQDINSGCMRAAYFEDGSPLSKWGADKWLSLAANRGSAAAMVELANILLNSYGRYGPNSSYEAFKWASMAANRGHAGGMTYLGEMYWTRQYWDKAGGSQKDRDLAVKWWQKAAALGNERAKENIEKASKDDIDYEDAYKRRKENCETYYGPRLTACWIGF
jgi:TPR repeat protein